MSFGYFFVNTRCRHSGTFVIIPGVPRVLSVYTRWHCTRLLLGICRFIPGISLAFFGLYPVSLGYFQVYTRCHSGTFRFIPDITRVLSGLYPMSLGYFPVYLLPDFVHLREDINEKNSKFAKN